MSGNLTQNGIAHCLVGLSMVVFCLYSVQELAIERLQGMQTFSFYVHCAEYILILKISIVLPALQLYRNEKIYCQTNFHLFFNCFVLVKYIFSKLKLVKLTFCYLFPQIFPLCIYQLNGYFFQTFSLPKSAILPPFGLLNLYTNLVIKRF